MLSAWDMQEYLKEKKTRMLGKLLQYKTEKKGCPIKKDIPYFFCLNLARFYTLTSSAWKALIEPPLPA